MNTDGPAYSLPGVRTKQRRVGASPPPGAGPGRRHRRRSAAAPGQVGGLHPDAEHHRGGTLRLGGGGRLGHGRGEAAALGAAGRGLDLDVDAVGRHGTTRAPARRSGRRGCLGLGRGVRGSGSVSGSGRSLRSRSLGGRGLGSLSFGLRGGLIGRGLFRGIELVEDRATKTSFDPARKLHAKIKAAAMAEGLICYPAGGTVDGRRGDHVLLAPPFIITEDQIGELVGKLGRAIDTALAA